ncbi:MAG: hypothetical protein KatS3mg090_0225 [Patescibacteria group bacterium]|nr:MAG: hypothetical protein KatS3mg090_0225 [Patescibacteria group bacterium]
MIEIDLTQRQLDILKKIIEEYTNTGLPVGSELLEKKYKIGASPATIRNEMVVLAKKGYLSKSYFSSGRIPTAKAYRLYIQHMMEPSDITTAEAVGFKNSIWDDRKEFHKLLQNSTRVLALKTRLLCIALSQEGDLYFSGVANILNFQEFLEEEEKLPTIFSKFEDDVFWTHIIKRIEKLHEDLMIFLGEEDIQDPTFDNLAGVMAEFQGRSISGYIGVVGTKRIYYDEVIPKVKYMSSLISEILVNEGY